ncbi:MAG: adenylate kinase [Clostridia bacterium]|nr:adenylate kinase [Clostridia bacterium]
MKKVIVIGCPGSGKSVFSRELHEITGLPLYPLDMIRWRPDKTFIPREQLIERLMEIFAEDEWIIDGNYGSTMELRMTYCDTIFFLDYPTELCYESIMKRRGTVRPDLPWVESHDDIDEDFVNTVLNYNKINRPAVLERLERFSDREIHIFKNREEATAFLESLKRAPAVRQ